MAMLTTSPEITKKHMITTPTECASTFTLQGLETQVASKQDMVRTGKYLSPNTTDVYNAWIVVADGHGVGNIIDTLKKADWNAIMESENTMALIYKMIGNVKNTICDGTTLSVVKITSEGIKCWWIGDSQIRIFRDKKSFWKSNNHNGENNKELTRIRNKCIQTEPAWSLSVLDEECLSMKRSHYFHHKINGGIEKLAMSRVLGHNNEIYPFVESQFISFEKHKKYSWKIVVASDGLWDVMCERDTPLLASPKTTAKSLTDLALNRWMQNWIYVEPTNTRPLAAIKMDKRQMKEKIQGGGDDIGIAVWSDCR